MKFKPIHQLCLIGMIGIVTFSACTKDSKEEAHLSQRNATSNAFVFYEQNQLESKLAQFWVNYQLFLGLEAGDAIHTLQATVNLDEATTLLHYALNVAFVDPRIAYDQEVAGNFEKNITWPQGEQITNQQLCSLFHQIATDVKAVRNQITDPNKAINRLSISPLVSGNSVAFQINYLMSHGNVWSKEDLNDPANFTPSGINFNAPTPWISQQSFEGLENPNNQTTGHAPTPRAQYYMWLFTNNDAGTTLTQRQATFNSALENVKALHQYFTSRSVYWPNPVEQLNGGFPGYIGVMPVMTPDSRLLGEFFPNNSNFGAVVTTDVINCDNPNMPASGVQPIESNMVPSKLLGYFGREYDYSLSSARKVDQNTINFFWAKRPSIAVISTEKNADDINRAMSRFQTGFYAMTGYHTLPNKNKNYTGLCQSGSICNGMNACLYATEYYLEGEFSHYRLLPLTPAQLAQYF